MSPLIAMRCAELMRLAVDPEGESIEQQAQSGEHQIAGLQSHTHSQPTVSNPNAVPPSPPIDPQLGFDDSYQSPSATSSHSSPSGPQYFGGTISTIELPKRRQPPSSSALSAHAISSQTTQGPYQNSPYPPSPSAGSNYSYPSPAVTGAQSMYYQRPLPSNFPPPSISGGPSNLSIPNSQEASPTDPNNHGQWQQQHQHHHYIAPSSSTNFTGQSQDRYVCQVCTKAFSRPSSLRIHSHSHTGEKPFLCPHKGCGKAFSVRSNMKRHERGCHGGGSPGST